MIKPEPAIYKLENKRTFEIYVGGTRNAQGRKRNHEYDLRKLKHRNPKLQQSYIDGDRFDFVVLEYLPIDISDDGIVRREQKWIKFLNPFYNSRNAVPLFGSDIYLARERKLAGRKGRKQTQEEKDRRAESVKRYWEIHPHRTLSEEEKKNISIKVRGENHPRWGAITPEDVKNKIADSVSKTEYSFISPDGTVFHFRNLRLFCRIHGLSNSTMYKLTKGEIKSGNHKGWVFKDKVFIGYNK